MDDLETLEAWKSMKPTIILLNKYGQLGNRLYVYARFIALSLEWDARLLHQGFLEYAPYFQGTVGRLTVPFPSTGLRWPMPLVALFARLVAGLQKRGVLRPPTADYTVCWQDYEKGTPIPSAQELKKSFDRCRVWRIHEELLFSDVRTSSCHAEIREFFRLVPDLQKKLNRVVAQARAGVGKVVGVHLRRGDYRGFADGKYFYSDQQYAQVMRQLESLLTVPVRFVLVSNEPYERVAFSEFDWVSGDGQMAVDCYTLAECDYIIGPQSTFSGWASFYGSVPLYWIYDPNIEFTLDAFSVRKDL